MKIVAGLGNPGEEYRNTYHNVGLLALDAIARKEAGDDAEIGFEPHKDLFRFAKIGQIALVTPLTFMNESGQAIREAVKKFGATPEEIVILHDESDLPVGKYKISEGGGSAGHKGIQSIIDSLHSESFTRVRIGIRDPQEQKRKKAEEFVLKKISPRDREALEEVFAAVTTDVLGSSD